MILTNENDQKGTKKACTSLQALSSAAHQRQEDVEWVKKLQDDSRKSENFQIFGSNFKCSVQNCVKNRIVQEYEKKTKQTQKRKYLVTIGNKKEKSVK